MRAHKRNPWRGRGLDKRQARRARRRAERRIAWVDAFMEQHAPDFKLMEWQREVLRATQGPYRSAMIVTPRRVGRGLAGDLVRLLADEGRMSESRRFVLDKWISEGES